MPNTPNVTDGTATPNGGSVQQDGCAAGSIRHAFRIELTRQQTRELKEVWAKHSVNRGMIILQPVLNFGPFDLKNCFVQGAVLDEKTTAQIMAVIESAKQHNDPSSATAPAAVVERKGDY